MDSDSSWSDMSNALPSPNPRRRSQTTIRPNGWIVYTDRDGVVTIVKPVLSEPEEVLEPSTNDDHVPEVPEPVTNDDHVPEAPEPVTNDDHVPEVPKPLTNDDHVQQPKEKRVPYPARRNPPVEEVETLGSAAEAVKRGAKRIQLCSSLKEGGVTPSGGFLRKVKERFPEITVFVMIRPRSGDFVYSEDEIDIMKSDIEQLKESGADGFVFGVLTKDGELDHATCRDLACSAHPKQWVFHRQFVKLIDPDSIPVPAPLVGPKQKRALYPYTPTDHGVFEDFVRHEKIADVLTTREEMTTKFMGSAAFKELVARHHGRTPTEGSINAQIQRAVMLFTKLSRSIK